MAPYIVFEWEVLQAAWRKTLATLSVERRKIPLYLIPSAVSLALVWLFLGIDALRDQARFGAFAIGGLAAYVVLVFLWHLVLAPYSLWRSKLEAMSQMEKEFQHSLSEIEQRVRDYSFRIDVLQMTFGYMTTVGIGGLISCRIVNDGSQASALIDWYGQLEAADGSVIPLRIFRYKGSVGASGRGEKYSIDSPRLPPSMQFEGQMDVSLLEKVTKPIETGGVRTGVLVYQFMCRDAAQEDWMREQVSKEQKGIIGSCKIKVACRDVKGNEHSGYWIPGNLATDFAELPGFEM